MERKGQAAMEFLMTYGWAILAAIIAIGVLAYFGVFSPGQYTTGSAVVSPPFYVNAHNVQADTDDVTAGAQDGVVLELQNNGGENYDVQSVDVTNCGTFSTLTAITAGGKSTITVDCTVAPALAAGDNFKGDITVNYRKASSLVDLTSTGNIAAKVVA